MKRTLHHASHLLLAVLLTACASEKKLPPDTAGISSRPPESTADRIYSDGNLAQPEPQAADLGMAQPGEKITIDTK